MLGELLLAGKPTMPEEKHHLFKGRVFHQIVDIVSPIKEAAFPPVNKADRGGTDNHTFEAGRGRGGRCGHGAVSGVFVS